MEKIEVILRTDTVSALNEMATDLLKKYSKERVYSIIINGAIETAYIHYLEIQKKKGKNGRKHTGTDS